MNHPVYFYLPKLAILYSYLFYFVLCIILHFFSLLLHLVLALNSPPSLIVKFAVTFFLVSSVNLSCILVLYFSHLYLSLKWYNLQSSLAPALHLHMLLPQWTSSPLKPGDAVCVALPGSFRLLVALALCISHFRTWVPPPCTRKTSWGFPPRKIW